MDDMTVYSDTLARNAHIARSGWDFDTIDPSHFELKVC